MYEFVDTNEYQETVSKPSEAVMINGEYLEDIIEGYRTVYVKGRESLARDLQTIENAVRDGSTVKGSRYPSRTLTVGFQILSDSAKEYMDKFTELNRVLMVENAEIVFDDEPDLFYVGTPISSADPEPGMKNVIAEFEIYCADPFKYSRQIYEAVGEWDKVSDKNTRTFEIDYQGNYPAAPILEAQMATTTRTKVIESREYEFYLSESQTELTGGEWIDNPFDGDSAPAGYYIFKREHRILDTGVDEYWPTEDGISINLYEDEEEPNTTNGGEDERVHGDCGYVAFYDDNNHIIQLGNPYQNDKEEYDSSQVLVNRSFENIGNWGAEARAAWPNTGIVPNVPGTFDTQFTRMGSFDLALDHYSAKDTAKTSATLWSGSHKTGGTTVKEKKKKVKYNVITYSNLKATASNRKSSTVTLDVELTAKAHTKCEKKLVLTGELTINGAKYTFQIKGKTEWKTGTHTIKKSITVKDLSLTTNKLTFKFSVSQSGSTGASMNQVSCNALSIPTAPETPTTGYYLTPSAYESGSGWHGPCIKRTLPADDSNNREGAQRFTFEWKTRICVGNDTTNASAQLGAQSVLLTDSSGGVVAGVRIEKTKVGNTGSVHLIVNDKIVKSLTNYPFSYVNDALGASGTVMETVTEQKTVTKKGVTTTTAGLMINKFVAPSNLCRIVSTENGSISFNIGGRTFNYTDSHNKVVAISFGIYQLGNNPPLRFNGINSVKFIKDFCETNVDIPNTFSTGDRVIADCATAEIRINEARRPDVGALGNDWEDFRLVKGNNVMQGAFSEWAEDEPIMKIRWREVFI